MQIVKEKFPVSTGQKGRMESRMKVLFDFPIAESDVADTGNPAVQYTDAEKAAFGSFVDRQVEMSQLHEKHLESQREFLLSFMIPVLTLILEQQKDFPLAVVEKSQEVPDLGVADMTDFEDLLAAQSPGLELGTAIPVELDVEDLSLKRDIYQKLKKPIEPVNPKLLLSPKSQPYKLVDLYTLKPWQLPGQALKEIGTILFGYKRKQSRV